MRKSEQMLFALLRSSLHEKEAELSFFQNITGDHWKECYQLAVSQGVMALAWDGVLMLPNELQPPRALKLAWGLAVEKYEARYLRYCKVVDKISKFYAEHGITTVQLKGVGFSTLYPVPSHREGGDIDIYTYSSDRSEMSDAQANILADTLMVEQGIEVENHSYKHSNFYYMGIPVENHKVFLNVKDMKEAECANGILQRELDPQTVSLAYGQVNIPSAKFNTLFIAFHAFQHYGSGLALHHLCDWAVILKNYGLLFPQQMMESRFYDGVKALTVLCNKLLGTNVQVDGDEKLAQKILGEILDPAYTVHVPCKTKIGVFLYKTRRFIHNYRIKSHIFDISLAKHVWGSAISHIRNPKTIFERNEK